MARAPLPRITTIAALLFTAGVIAAAMPAGARASDSGDFGLGLIVGDPTGASAKYFLSSVNAIDGAVGFGFIGGNHISLHADLLWHFPVQQWPQMQLDLYLGVGPRFGIRTKKRDDNVLIGGRGPIGIALTFRGAPIDIFLEAAAGLWIVEKFGFDLDAAIGARFWF